MLPEQTVISRCTLPQHTTASSRNATIHAPNILEPQSSEKSEREHSPSSIRNQPALRTTTVMAHEACPEQLLDVFRTAALSVTKLYKSSITAQAKARSEGYQDCLDDLLQFLDKENLGVDDGEGWKIRAWANERLGARDASPQVMESDDDAEKPEPMSSPEIHRSNSTSSTTQAAVPQQQQNTQQQPLVTAVEPQREIETETPIMEEIAVDEPEIVVPAQDTFDFRSSLPYPQQDAQNQLNIGSLRLSDNRPHDNTLTQHTTPRASRSARLHGGSAARRGPRNSNHGSGHLGRGAGTKRQLNYEELFGLANLGQVKDGFGNPANKRRHI